MLIWALPEHISHRTEIHQVLVSDSIENTEFQAHRFLIFFHSKTLQKNLLRRKPTAAKHTKIAVWNYFTKFLFDRREIYDWCWNLERTQHLRVILFAFNNVHARCSSNLSLESNITHRSINCGCEVISHFPIVSPTSWCLWAKLLFCAQPLPNSRKSTIDVDHLCI